MGIYIENLTNGKYGLKTNNYLRFKVGNESNQIIVIDKQSALEITHTLIDSLGMLDKEVEDLICKMQEEIYNY